MSQSPVSGHHPIFPSANTAAYEQAFSRGRSLHQQGQLEAALMAFEQALQLQPENVHAASACATMLMELQRPQQAYAALAKVREYLLQDSDGATNWAIVCEVAGQDHEARSAYEQAIALNSANLRALNNLALQLLQRSEWTRAIELLERCVRLQPQEPAFWVNWCDALSAAHERERALQVASQALQTHPAHPALALRRAAQLAHCGHIEDAQHALESLNAEGKQLLSQYLSGLSDAAERVGGAIKNGMLDAQLLYFVMSFGAFNDCDWRGRDQLTQLLRQAIAQAERQQEAKYWRDVQFYALLLPLTEEEHAQAMRATYRSIRATNNIAPPQRAEHTDGRIRLGIATQSLHDPRHRNMLLHWLSHMDRSRFVIHLYANTPNPQASLAALLHPLCDSLVEIHHLSAKEAAQRIRLDQLDIFLDTAFYTPSCRAELPYLGIAPIRIRLQAWTRWISGILYTYNIGDPITHPDEFDRIAWGPTLRLPQTCWLSPEPMPELPPIDRRQALLPESALVLCGFTAGSTLDADSFSLWMKCLQHLPDAVLWLPSYHAGARANLQREAKLAGVASHRLIFSQDIVYSMADHGQSSRAQQLVQLKLADLFLDPIRMSAAHNLCDSLRMGVPSITQRGHNMASRLGASIVSAAGLPDAVVNSNEQWLEAILHWGKSPAMQEQWRTHLQRSSVGSPKPSELFNAAARVQDWQRAFEAMHLSRLEGSSMTAMDIQ